MPSAGPVLSQVKQRVQSERVLDVLETFHVRLCALEGGLRDIRVSDAIDIEEIRKLQKEFAALSDMVRRSLLPRKP